MQGAKVFGKPMVTLKLIFIKNYFYNEKYFFIDKKYLISKRINFARTKSDIIAKAEGTFIKREKLTTLTLKE